MEYVFKKSDVTQEAKENQQDLQKYKQQLDTARSHITQLRTQGKFFLLLLCHLPHHPHCRPI